MHILYWLISYKKYNPRQWEVNPNINDLFKILKKDYADKEKRLTISEPSFIFFIYIL